MSDKKKVRLKQWHYKSRFILILFGAVAIIVYLIRAGRAKEYAGLGAALCVIACGLFLVWHAFHLFLEEDELEQKYIEGKPDSAPQLNPSSPQPNPPDTDGNSEGSGTI